MFICLVFNPHFVTTLCSNHLGSGKCHNPGCSWLLMRINTSPVMIPKVCLVYMGVSKNRGAPKWMVYNGKPYFLMDDLGRNTHYFRKHPYGFSPEKKKIWGKFVTDTFSRVQKKWRGSPIWCCCIEARVSSQGSCVDGWYFGDFKPPFGCGFNLCK